jgi:hypothetical protein
MPIQAFEVQLGAAGPGYTAAHRPPGPDLLGTGARQSFALRIAATAATERPLLRRRRLPLCPSRFPPVGAAMIMVKNPRQFVECINLTRTLRRPVLMAQANSLLLNPDCIRRKSNLPPLVPQTSRFLNTASA